jgi:methionyl-tRNA synthetase
MSKKKIFIGVAWPYVNGDLHPGHLAGYLLPADILARFNRFIGNDVLMVSGSDCFGTPVALEADKHNLPPAEIVKKYHEKNLNLFKDLNLSFDIYTKTDNPIHKKVVQDIFVKLVDDGYIYIDSSDQYYSETEKRFLPDRYVEGICPHCGYTEARSDQCENCNSLLAQGELKNPLSKLTKTPVIIKPSEHYFFALPKFADFLKKYLADHGQNWRPWIINEALRWLKDGLKARAITRDLDWGVEIPVDRMPADKIIKGHEQKRIYVWFEAVIGYLSASIQYSQEHNNELWKDFWYNDEAKHYYFMGKDNLIFHTLFWPSQLHAYDEKLHLPDVPAINQFLTLNNQGFSKSRGITLNTRKIFEDFGLDLVRFYFTLIMPENHDSDFTWKDFIAKANNSIIANLGNFINRTLKLAENLNFSDLEVTEDIKKIIHEYLKDGLGENLIQDCRFKNYAENILSISAGGNFYLSRGIPWKIKEEDPKQYKEIMFGAIAITIALATMLRPITPDTAKKLETMLGIEIESWPDEKMIIELAKKVKITNTETLFKKIEADPEKENFNEKYK